MEMIPVYAPQSESEASVISSLMEAYQIEHFIRGGAFSTMYPGALSTSLNAQMLMVHPDQVELAKQLLKEFLEQTDSSAEQ